MTHPSANRPRAIFACASLLHAVLPLWPLTAHATGWEFDRVYGAAGSVALPAGQATLVLDGAGRQARSIAYTPADGSAAIDIARAYGPGERKAIESENGVTRHHVHGGGLSPIMRTESDGGLTYQLGTDTIAVAATGAGTVAHRVEDLKRSTVAVLGDQRLQAEQRVSYASFGAMRAEQAGTGPYAVAALLAGYESLTAWTLGSDQLVDNHARLYDPASGRFLALDRVRQAVAYEARGNEPVSRVDPDGNLNFDQLIAALKQDRRIAIGFGDYHNSLEMPSLLRYFTTRLQAENIPFRIFQEADLLARTPATNNVVQERFRGSPLERYVFDLLLSGLITDLGSSHSELTHEQTAQFKATYKPDGVIGDYKVYQSNFDTWTRTIPGVLAGAARDNVVSLFFLGANHYLKFENSLQNWPTLIVTADNHKILAGRTTASLIPLSSYGLQSKFNLVTIVSNQFANLTRPDPAVFTALDFRIMSATELPLPYQVQIPEQALIDHNALAAQYNQELAFHLAKKRMFASMANMNQNNGSDGKDEKDENDEKNAANDANRNRQPSILPVKKPDAFFSSKFHEK